MANANTITKVVGVRVQLTMDEAFALVNTAERLGELVDAIKSGGELTIYDVLTANMDELETLFDVSRAVGSVINESFRSNV